MAGNANGAPAADELEYGVLGPLEVRRGGNPLQLGGSRQRGLLAYLLLHVNRPVRTEDLVTALWRDPPPSCRKIVQIAISQLRRSLGDNRLATEAHGYRLTADPMAIDVHRFGSLANHGRDASARGDAATAADYLDRALALWRGPALADLDEEPFVAAERRFLEAARLAATEDRIDAELALGREHALIGELEALVADEPLRERPRAQLMIALYRAGRQPEALEVYQSGRKALLEQAGVEPSPKLKRLERAILRQDGSLEHAVARAHRPGLPAPANRLIGRDRDLQQVCAVLRRNDVRLVTITGPGGVGKTRVALEAARILAPDLVDGVGVRAARRRSRSSARRRRDRPRARRAPRRRRRSVDASRPPRRPLDAARARQLRAPDRRLDVPRRARRDDADAQAPRHEPRLAPALARARARARSAARSSAHRKRSGALAGAAAVELFLERARAVRPEHDLGRAGTAAVAEICRRLDGLPLSIELAAARTRFLAPPELLARLGRRLDLLVAGPLDAPARQRTLRATIEWSYQLLSRPEQLLFAQLGVFVGGCELEAAEAVCGGSADVLATLEGLAGHSLVQRRAGPGARIADAGHAARLRRRAARLERRGRPVRARHAAWYLDLAVTAEAELIGAEQPAWLRRLESDHANLTAALGWFDEVGDGPRLLRLATALCHYWRTNGYFEEARRWLARGLAAPGASPPVTRAKALRHAANFARLQLDATAAERLAAEALAVARTTDDVATLTGALSTAGNLACWTGHYRRARAVYEELLDVATGAGFERGRANAMINLSSLALLEGEPDRAARVGAEAVALASTQSDAETKAVALFNLGCAQLEAGEAELSARAFADSTRLCLDGGFREHLAYCLVGVAAVAERRGDMLDAGALLSAADTMLESMGAALAPYERLLRARTMSSVRTALAEDADRVWSEGRDRRPEETVEAALARLS